MSINEPTSPDELLIETYPEAAFNRASLSTPVTPAAINPDDPPWRVKQAILVWFVSVAFLFFVPLVTVIPYVIYKALVHGSVATLAADPNLIFISILGVFPTHVLTFAVCWFVVTNRGRRPFWPALGWNWPRNFRPLKTIGLAVLLLAAGSLLTLLLGGSETQLDLIINSSLKARFATAFLAAVTGPFVEEVVYRGVLYSALQRALGVSAAVATVSALFAGVHVFQYYNNLGVIAVITLLSVSLTLVRARSGSLLPSYVMHLVFNGIQAVILVLQPFVIKKSVVENEAAAGVLIHIFSRFLT